MLEIVSGDVGMIQSRYDKIEKMINESVAYELEQLILNYSLVEARKSYREIKQNAKHYFDEAEINTAAYRFMRRKEYDEAAFLFRINVKQYPQSANAFDSYAEVLLALDKKKEALENYKKSLELNPENENAKKMIEELQKK